MDQKSTVMRDPALPAVDHIERKPGVCGGKPCIRGTRIRVWDVHVWHDLRGQTPAEIVALFPQLSLADIHAALAYYLDYRDDIETEMSVGDALAAGMEAEQGTTRLALLRAQLGKDGNADAGALSPG